MSLPEVYGLKIGYEDRLQLYLKAIKLYVDIKKIDDTSKSLGDRPLELLSYYLLEGYSDETKEFIQKNLGLTSKNVNTVNRVLTKKGYLAQDKNNFHTKVLNPDLEKLKSYIDTNKDLSKFFLIKFVRQ